MTWFANRSVWQICLILLGENIVVFTSSLALGLWIRTRWPVTFEGAVDQVAERSPAAFASLSVLMNTSVSLLGWVLWNHGWLKVSSKVTGWVLIDILIMVLVVDALMYVSHRLAHHPVIYPLIHTFHHRYVEPRPIVLFVLHPVEAFGFGVGWIAVIAAASVLGHSLSALAIVAFAGINLLFGTLGHTGVDPVPERWRQLRIFRYVATPIFHAQHHLDPGVNFGFFTVIWDRWFRTTDPTYTFGC